MRKEKERYEAGLEAETGEDAESLTETDGEGPSQKRKRGKEVTNNLAGFLTGFN